MPYQTVFQIDYSRLEWWPSAVCFGFAFILFLWARKIRPISQAGSKLLVYSLSAVVTVFGLLLSAVLGGKFYVAYRDFRAGRVEVVEGRVDDFHAMPPEGGEYESFRVQDVKFHYSDFESNPGFNRTASHGGPIRQGLPVRVTYIRNSDTDPEGNVIVKLEIEKAAKK